MIEEIELLAKLIEIPSQIGVNKEKEISFFLADLLKKNGFSVEMFEFAKDRPNIIAKYRFKNSGPTIIFNGHMDTAPYYNEQNSWETDPGKAIIKNDKVYGRGSCDMKGGIACALVAIFKCIKENSGCGSIVVNFVSDEENTSIFGTIPLCNNNLIDGDFAIVLEPTECVVCPQQLGNMFFATRINGIGGHTGFPNGKINPFDIAIDYIDVMKKWADEKKEKKDDLQPFINIGHFEGGTCSGTIPDNCSIFWGTRVLPNDTFERYLDEINRITDDFRKNLTSPCEIETVLFEGGGTDSFSCSSKFIDLLVGITGKEKGVFPASCDAGFINKILGIDSAVTGRR